MTTEGKVLALLNAVQDERGIQPTTQFYPRWPSEVALCRAIEQHEAFRQEVSDALLEYYGGYHNASGEPLERFIILAPKADPLVEVIAECDDGTWETKAEYAEKFRAALAARGLEIREKNDG